MPYLQVLGRITYALYDLGYAAFNVGVDESLLAHCAVGNDEVCRPEDRLPKLSRVRAREPNPVHVCAADLVLCV